MLYEVITHACEELIIYPSEEYPCSCEKYLASMADDCLTCGHEKATESSSVQPPSRR